MVLPSLEEARFFGYHNSIHSMDDTSYKNEILQLDLIICTGLRTQYRSTRL